MLLTELFVFVLTLVKDELFQTLKNFRKKLYQFCCQVSYRSRYHQENLQIKFDSLVIAHGDV